MTPDPSVVVHDTALCETEDVGPRTKIFAFAHLMPGARIGADCKIGDHVFIEGGAVIGDRVTVKNNALVWFGVRIECDVFIGPGAVFTNDLVPRVRFPKPLGELVTTMVREGASIGANATVLCGIEVGEHALIGAGSVVVDDVPAFGIVVGNPARLTGWCCQCGERIDGSAILACRCGRRYERVEDGGVRLCSAPGVSDVSGRGPGSTPAG